MRMLLSGLAVLLLLLVGAVVALPYLVPQAWLKEQVAHQLRQATGREVTVSGEASVRVLPALAAELGGLRIANAEGFAEPHFLAAEAVVAELALWPLLSSRIEVDRFVVAGADLRLETDAAGNPNWVFERVGEPGAADPAPGSTTTTADADEPASARGARATSVTLGDIRLERGSVRFTDGRTGVVRTFDGIEGAIAMAALDAPLTLDVRGELDRRPVDVALALATPAALLGDQVATAEVSLDSDGLRLRFDGSVQLAAAPRVAGDLELAVEAAPATLSWLTANPVDLPLDTLGLTARVEATPSRVALSDLALSADELTGTGVLEVALAGSRPAVSGSLAIGAVDLAALTKTPDGGSAGAPSDGTAGAATRPPDAAPAGGGWSTAPIDMPPLPVDLDVAVTVESLRAPPLRFGAGAAHLGGSDGALDVTLERLAFYGGDAHGQVVVEPTAGGMTVAKSVALDGFATGPLLDDLTGNAFLDGTGNLRFEGGSQGSNMAELVGSAAGEGRFDIGRAVLTGLAGRPELEALRVLLLLGGEPGSAPRLADIGGSFTMTDGIVANDDFGASTPALRITGAGTIDLPQKRIPRYTLTPQAAGALGVLTDVQTFMVPVIVEGPFDRLSVRPDPTAAVVGPLEGAAEALERAQEQVGDGDLEGAAETIINEGVGGVLRGLGLGR